MKKLQLKTIALGNSLVLTREQLKNIMAGTESGGVACYQCCTTSGPEICGHCSATVYTGCQGNGKAWPCFCY